MHRSAKMRIAFGSTVAIALLSLQFTTDPIHPAAAADRIPRMPPAEEMRWWDERIGRTTLIAFFQGPAERHCSNLAGVLTRQGDRVELLYPRVVAPTVWHGSRDTAGELLFEDERCHIRVHFTQGIPDNDRSVTLARNDVREEFLVRRQESCPPGFPDSCHFPSAQREGHANDVGWTSTMRGDGLASKVVTSTQSAQASCSDWSRPVHHRSRGAMLVYRRTRGISCHLPHAQSSLAGRWKRVFVLATATCRFDDRNRKRRDEGRHEWTRLDPQLD